MFIKKMVNTILDKTVDNLISKIEKLPLEDKDCWFSSKWEKTIWETIWTLSQLIETIWTNQITEKNIKKIKDTTNQQINKVLNKETQKALKKFREIKFEEIQDKFAESIDILDRIDVLFETIQLQNHDFYDHIINFQNYKKIIESNLVLFSWEEKTILETRLKFYQDQIEGILEQYKLDRQQQ
jgi:hypothetical protein